MIANQKECYLNVKRINMIVQQLEWIVQEIGALKFEIRHLTGVVAKLTTSTQHKGAFRISTVVFQPILHPLCSYCLYLFICCLHILTHLSLYPCLQSLLTSSYQINIDQYSFQIVDPCCAERKFVANESAGIHSDSQLQFAQTKFC